MQWNVQETNGRLPSEAGTLGISGGTRVQSWWSKLCLSSKIHVYACMLQMLEQIMVVPVLARAQPNSSRFTEQNHWGWGPDVQTICLSEGFYLSLALSGPMRWMPTGCWSAPGTFLQHISCLVSVEMNPCHALWDNSTLWTKPWQVGSSQEIVHSWSKLKH